MGGEIGLFQVSESVKLGGFWPPLWSIPGYGVPKCHVFDCYFGIKVKFPSIMHTFIL